MTRHDDIERVLEQWLREGPLHMSDRLFEGTLERIERQPDERFVAVRLRLSTMHVNVRLAAAAAVLVIVTGAGLAVLGRLPSVGSHPSPIPSTTPVPSVTADATAPAKHVAELFRPFGVGTSGTLSYLGYNTPTGSDSVAYFPTLGGTEIAMASSFVPFKVPAGCAASVAPVDGTSGAITAWIRSFPNLAVTKPAPVAIGGLSGLMVDISIKPQPSGHCGSNFILIVDNIFTKVTVDSKTRYILLDRGDGQSLIITLVSRLQPTWDGFTAAMAFVETFEFSR